MGSWVFTDHEIEFGGKRGKYSREARNLRKKKETIIVEKLLLEIQVRGRGDYFVYWCNLWRVERDHHPLICFHHYCVFEKLDVWLWEIDDVDNDSRCVTMYSWCNDCRNKYVKYDIGIVIVDLLCWWWWTWMWFSWWIVGDVKLVKLHVNW